MGAYVIFDSGTNPPTYGRKICRTPDGKLHAITGGSSDGKDYACSEDGGITWTKESIVFTGYPNIASDSQGNIFVVGYGAYGIDNIYCRKRSAAGVWGNVEWVTTNDTVPQRWTSIAIDKDDNVWAGWQSCEANRQVHLRKRSSAGVWGDIIDIDNDLNYANDAPNIAIDFDNNVHLVWNGWHAGSPSITQICYKKCVSGVWQAKQYLTNEDANQSGHVIAIGKDNSVHIVWVNTSGSYICHIRYENGSWSSIKNITDAGSSCSVSVDGTGYVHILYQKNGCVQEVKYKNGEWLSPRILTDSVYWNLPDLWANFPVVQSKRISRAQNGVGMLWAKDGKIYFQPVELSWDLGFFTDTTPRISWTYSDPESEAQDGYQVQIDRANTFSSNNGSPDFDSGIISSANHYHDVVSPLSVNGKLFVRVRTRDANHVIGECPWSVENYFILYPSENIVGVDKPVFYATIPSDPENNNLHFTIQVDNVDDFASSIINKSSSVSQVGWEYWNGLSWVAVPPSGVTSVYYGNQVRYKAQDADALSSFGTYAFRIKAVEA